MNIPHTERALDGTAPTITAVARGGAYVIRDAAGARVLEEAAAVRPPPPGLSARGASLLLQLHALLAEPSGVAHGGNKDVMRDVARCPPSFSAVSAGRPA